MVWYEIIAVVGVGVVAGFINTVAGSGSLLTLPLLMFLGLPANIANGTNRVAILLQNIVAVSTFKKKKVLDIKTDYRLVIPAVIGAIAGAFVAVDMNEVILKRVIGVVIVFMFFMVLLKPDIWIKGKAGVVNTKPGIWQYVIFLGIGFYGGFIQAGVGLFLLAGLVMGAGYDLVKANAVKVLIVFAYTIFALAIFIYNKQVDFTVGLILAVGNMTGAWLGANFSVKKGPTFVRYFLILVLFIVSLKLFGVF